MTTAVADADKARATWPTLSPNWGGAQAFRALSAQRIIEAARLQAQV